MIDRTLQRTILQELAEIYPNSANLRTSFQEHDEREVLVSLFYLSEHKLINFDYATLLSGGFRLGAAKITAAGIDFLSDDGGLSAILGVVTVKLHEDTIKELLIKKVEQSSAEPTVKKKLIDQIKSLPAEMTKVATVEGLKAGIDSVPDVIQWLQKSLGLS